jgi:hypothetical protein
MLKWLLRRFLPGPKPPPLPDLLSVPRADVEHLWHRQHDFPRIDWFAADRWIAARPQDQSPNSWRRAIMAACLDEVRDSLTTDHRRWRSAHVEGLAPLEGGTGHSVKALADRAFVKLHADLQPIRGSGPIPPIAIVLIEPMAAYLDFTSTYFPDEGEFATSGGLYLNEGPDAFPLIAVNASSRHACEATVAHELTHHALHGCNLPPWAEEGLTQMMEERLARAAPFTLSHEQVHRHRECWDDANLPDLLDGSAFLSPHDDVQELAYHLALWIVHAELAANPKRFFAFLAACRELGPDQSSLRHLGQPPIDLIKSRLFGPE